MNNTLIEGDGETARAVTYLTVFDSGASSGAPPHVWLTDVYYDTVRKVDGRWRIAYRNFVRDDLRDEQPPGFLL